MKPQVTGSRGLKRQRALGENGAFRSFDPLIRLVARWIARLPLGERRNQLDQQLMHAGDWMGLTPDEFVALSIISAVGAGLAGVVLGALISLSPAFGAIFFTMIGSMMPYSRVTGEIQDRFRGVSRSLPGAIDLAALCMGAGLDFPGALRQLSDKVPSKDNPLVEEIGRILQELELGRTRKQALENFAIRVPVEAVQDFVGSVVQAEEKGNPLAEVLRIQAHMLRMRRSIAAEESAARAALLMMLPLMLIFCAVLLIIMGPFMLQLANSGF